MKNRQTMVFLFIMAASWFLMWKLMPQQPQQPVVKQDPVKLLQQAKSLAEKGDYKTAFKTYDKVASEAKGTGNGVQAMLEKAALQEAAYPDSKHPKIAVKTSDERAAVATYKSLISDYGKIKDSEVAGKVAAAKIALNRLEREIDEKESKTWLYRSMDSLVRFSRSLGMGSYSYAFALFLITLMVKVLTWKLSAVQYKSMRDMQRVQPLIKQLQEKYKGNPKDLNTKVMELYKREGVNPLSGCLPMLVQFPILIYVYKAILAYEFQFQNGVFLWINSFMHSKFSFVGANLSQPDMPLVVLYTLSMFITQKLTVVDPTQAQQQKIMSIAMPLMFAFLFRGFASAFLLYWLLLNIVMTLHQYYVLRPTSQPAPALIEEAAPTQPARPRRKRRR